MSETQILTVFKSSLLAFFQELIDQFPAEGDLLVIHIFLDNQIPIKEVMDIFTHKLNRDGQLLKTMVKERNEDFFLEHNLFDALGKNKVSHFKKLWTSGMLDKENKQVVWSWIDSFIDLSDRYSKVKSS